MKGGVIKRFPEEDDFETLLNFIANSECEIFTDNSISCITYKCTLKPEIVESPYIACRSTNLTQSVKSILLKVFLHSEEFKTVTGAIKTVFTYKDRSETRSETRNNTVECTTNGMIDREVRLQSYAYNKSYSSNLTTCEPICPSIIMYTPDKLEDLKKSKLLEILLSKLKNREDLNDIDITEHWFSNDIAEQTPPPPKRQKLNKNALSEEEIYKQDGIKILAMEFMDGYITLKKYLEETKINNEVQKQKNAIHMCAWIFVYLSSCFGISHLDPHMSNVMFNPNIPYFSNNTKYENNYGALSILDLGQPLIIDFGRAEVIKGFKFKRNVYEIMMSIDNKEKYILELSKHYRSTDKKILYELWSIKMDYLDENYLNNLTHSRTINSYNFNKYLQDNYNISFYDIYQDFNRQQQNNINNKKKVFTQDNFMKFLFKPDSKLKSTQNKLSTPSKFYTTSDRDKFFKYLFKNNPLSYSSTNNLSSAPISGSTIPISGNTIPISGNTIPNGGNRKYKSKKTYSKLKTYKSKTKKHKNK